MPKFRAKPTEIDAIQWDGVNGDTLLTNFGSHISSYSGNPDGSLTVVTTDGPTYILALGDWLHFDILGALAITKKVAMYKQYDYVSG